MTYEKFRGSIFLIERRASLAELRNLVDEGY